MTAAVMLIWRAFCAFAALLSVVYLAGWLTNRYAPSSIDSGLQTTWSEAVRTDLLLLSLFALQHSGMARRAIKARFGRPTYLLSTALVLLLLFAKWEPMPNSLWFLTGIPALALKAIQIAGLILIGWSVGVTGTRTLLGLSAEGDFQARGPYRWVRHPMMTGTILVLWAYPELTEGRLLFNTFLTIYVLMAIRWEERDLSARFGATYDRYREATPALFRLPMQ
ncbi:MAG: isoprenylcysteine carboxylmethyltransferase family protein [Acidobacteriota bacterium]